MIYNQIISNKHMFFLNQKEHMFSLIDEQYSPLFFDQMVSNLRGSSRKINICLLHADRFRQLTLLPIIDENEGSIVEKIEVFEKNRFNRFDTHATAGLIRFAFVGTIMGATLLMVYFYLQSRLPQPLRITYCVVMVFAIAAIGWRMTQARQKIELLTTGGHSHA